LNSGLGTADEFHDHLDALLVKLRPAWAAFVDLGQRHEAEVGAAIYLYEAQGPVVEVLPDDAVALSELNAILDFDLYCLRGADSTGDQVGSPQVEASE
jgi:hypothetical protein